jgi:hypothetical protein
VFVAGAMKYDLLNEQNCELLVAPAQKMLTSHRPMGSYGVSHLPVIIAIGTMI